MAPRGNGSPKRNPTSRGRATVNGSPERNPTSRGRAIAPRPPATAALGVPSKTMGAAVQLGERGAWKSALPGTGCSVPGKAGDH